MSSGVTQLAQCDWVISYIFYKKIDTKKVIGPVRALCARLAQGLSSLDCLVHLGEVKFVVKNFAQKNCELPSVQFGLGNWHARAHVHVPSNCRCHSSVRVAVHCQAGSDYSITVVSHQEVAAVCIDAIAHHVGAKTARKDTD